MSQVNTLLTLRTAKSEHASKMAKMAHQTASGKRTSFAGVFSVSELNDSERQQLQSLLQNYVEPDGECDLAGDLNELVNITSEVKAINNQAALLHGERIKKAQTILTRYRDGAFTAWLFAAYGNRQTPYNFLQYYEFCELMPQSLRPRIEGMPRQAIYTLASRQGSQEQKAAIVETYQGETKTQLLAKIREIFPLSPQDKRAENVGHGLISQLSRMVKGLTPAKAATLSDDQKNDIANLLKQLRQACSA